MAALELGARARVGKRGQAAKENVTRRSMPCLAVVSVLAIVGCWHGMSYWRARRTAQDLKYLGESLERYQQTHGKLPAGCPATACLATLGIHTFPINDSWDAPRVYVEASDRQHFRLISGGSDRSVEPSSRYISPTKDALRLSSSYDDDTIIQDGQFAQIHEELRKLAR